METHLSKPANNGAFRWKVDMTGLNTYNILVWVWIKTCMVWGAMDRVRGCSAVDMGSGWRSYEWNEGRRI